MTLDPQETASSEPLYARWSFWFAIALNVLAVLWGVIQVVMPTPVAAHLQPVPAVTPPSSPEICPWCDESVVPSENGRCKP